MTTDFNQQPINDDNPPTSVSIGGAPRERYKFNDWNSGDEFEAASYREFVHFLVRSKGGAEQLIVTALEEMRDSDREDFDMASFSSEAAVFLAKAVQAKLDKRGHIFGYQPGK